MTIQLAIQFFKKHMPIITRRDPYAGPKTFMTWVFQEAISALEKQIPKKVDEDECECIVCNSAIDEKYASGLWDLAGEICENLFSDSEKEQDTVYYCLREWLEKQPYCPKCGQARNWSD